MNFVIYFFNSFPLKILKDCEEKKSDTCKASKTKTSVPPKPKGPPHDPYLTKEPYYPPLQKDSPTRNLIPTGVVERLSQNFNLQASKEFVTSTPRILQHVSIQNKFRRSTI